MVVITYQTDRVSFTKSHDNAIEFVKNNFKLSICRTTSKSKIKGTSFCISDFRKALICGFGNMQVFFNNCSDKTKFLVVRTRSSEWLIFIMLYNSSRIFSRIIVRISDILLHGKDSKVWKFNSEIRSNQKCQIQNETHVILHFDVRIKNVDSKKRWHIIFNH